MANQVIYVDCVNKAQYIGMASYQTVKVAILSGTRVVSVRVINFKASSGFWKGFFSDGSVIDAMS